MKPSDYVSIVKEIYKLCFDANKEKEIHFLNNNIRTLGLIYDSNDMVSMRNYLIREIFSSKNSYQIKTMLVKEVYNCDLNRLKTEILTLANALYNRVLYLQNIRPNTRVLEMAELILKINEQ